MLKQCREARSVNLKLTFDQLSISTSQDRGVDVHNHDDCPDKLYQGGAQLPRNQHGKLVQPVGLKLRKFIN